MARGGNEINHYHSTIPNLPDGAVPPYKSRFNFVAPLWQSPCQTIYVIPTRMMLEWGTFRVAVPALQFLLRNA